MLEAAPAGKLVTAEGQSGILGCFVVNMKMKMDLDSNSAASAARGSGFDTTAADALIAELQQASEDPTIQTASVVVSHRYSATINGFAACLSPASLTNVLENENVDFVEQDLKMTAFRPAQADPVWGLDRIDQFSGFDQYYDTGDLTGEGVDVYVVDTGINIRHSEYSARYLFPEEHS